MGLTACKLTGTIMLVMSCGALTISAQAAELFAPQGPVPVRNYQPIQGLSLQMPGESAIPLKKGDFSARIVFAETSTILRDVDPIVNAVLKLAQLRSTLDIRYGVFENTEFGLELGTIYRHSTGLDGLITAVERLFDRLAPLREQLSNSGYVYVINRNGHTILNPPNDAFGITDAVFHSKTLLSAERLYAPAMALRLAVKVPTGDQSRALGTGVADLGIGAALQKKYGDRVVLHINVNEILPTGRYLGVALRPYFTAVSGVEFLVTPKFSVTGQFDYYQSPFRDTGARMLDRGITEGVLAFGYRFTPRLLWQIYGVENLDFITGAAPDLTLATVLTYRIPSTQG